MINVSGDKYPVSDFSVGFQKCPVYLSLSLTLDRFDYSGRHL